MASGESGGRAERAAVESATMRRLARTAERRAERRAEEAEAQLRRLQARYDALARAAGALTWVGTADAPNADSALWFALTGQAPDAVAGTGWLDALHPDDRERVAQRWDRARQDASPFEMEYRLRDQAGAYHTLRARVVPVLEEDGTVREWVGRARDVTEQRRLERDLADRARDLETIFDTLMDGVVVVDGAGHLVRVNAAARRLYERAMGPGFMDRSMAERTASMALYDEAGQLLSAEAWPSYRILGGEIVDSQHAVDFHYRALDASPVWVSMSGKPLRDDDGQVVGAVLVYRDVDERRRAARRNQEALDALLAMAEAVVQSPNEETLAETADTGEMDPATAATEAPARHPIAYRMAELTCAVLGCNRVGITLIDPATQIQRPIVVVGLDPATERRWWKEQLAQTLRFGEAPAGSDPAETARFTAKFRAGETVVIDLTKPPYDQLPNDYNIHTMLAAPMLVSEQLVGILSLDHSGAEHEFTPDELRLAQGIARLTALVVERERLLEEREEARVRLRTLAETNRRMNEFLGVAGHELRTPLTSMKANVQLGQRYLAQTRQRATEVGNGVGHREGTGNGTGERTGERVGKPEPGAEPPERIAELFARIARQLGRQERLVNDMLDVSRLEGGRMELRMQPCDLGAIVRQEVEEQRLQHPERVIDMAVPHEAVPVLADGDRIAQAVTNYLTNAIKYAPAETPITVHVGVEEAAAGRVARVLVRDAGPGLAPEQRERIWERFHRAPDVLVRNGSGIGLGLGLYISRAIIERHDGEAGVESAPGEGSTFWFTLPLAESDNAELEDDGARAR